MFDVGGGELLLIIFAILLLFGPKKIPEIAQMVGKGMQKVRQAQAQFQSQLNDISTDVNKVTNIPLDQAFEKPQEVKDLQNQGKPPVRNSELPNE